jgi:transketolase
MDAVEQAKSGHPGMPMDMADAGTVRFTQFLRFDPPAPDWPDRHFGITPERVAEAARSLL